MAITTYTELRTAIENWLSHTLFTDRIPEFITLFEATANRKLRVRQQETVVTLTPSSGEASLPADYLQWRRVTFMGSPRVELDYVEPSWLQAAYPVGAAGTPTVFTIEGATMKIAPLSDTDLALVYFQKIPPLSDTNPTNWLIAAHPDLYLFGAMVEAEMFGVNDERMPLWKGRRDEIIEEIRDLSKASRGAGTMRVMGTVV